MIVIDFDINKKSEEELTQALILANATFDMKEVLSNSTPLDYYTVSILTPIQTINCAFHYEEFYNLHHAAITDLMLSRIYPNYKRKVYQGIYKQYSKNNVFVLTTETMVIILAREDIILTENQLYSLEDILHNISKSDYCKTNEITGNTTPYTICFDWFEDDEFYYIDEIDEIINLFKNRVSKINPEKQYNFSNYDFSQCRTKKDVLDLLTRYAKHHFDNKNLINGDEGR